MSSLSLDDKGNIVQAVKLSTAQVVNATASSVQSTAFADTTNLVRVVSTVDCQIAFGLSPTATTNSSILPAGVVEYFAVQPGGKVAVIKRTGWSDGVVSVTEVV